MSPYLRTVRPAASTRRDRPGYSVAAGVRVVRLSGAFRCRTAGDAATGMAAGAAGGPSRREPVDDRFAMHAASLLLKEPPQCPITATPAAASGVLTTTTTSQPSPSATGMSVGSTRRRP